MLNDPIEVIPDPAARATAAAAAVTHYRLIEIAALRELADCAGYTGAAEAVNALTPGTTITPQGVHARLARSRGVTAAASFPAEPGLYFADPEDAADVLRDWQLAHADLVGELPVMVSGAAAAGVAASEISDLTGLPVRTVVGLAVSPAGTAANVPLEVWDALVNRLADLASNAQSGADAMIYRQTGRALAAQLGLAVTADGHLPPVRAFTADPDDEAEMEAWLSQHDDLELEEPGPSANHRLGVDGWAALTCTAYERLAADPSGGATEEDDPQAAAYKARIAEGAGQAAALLRHVRTTGTLPDIA